MNSQLAKLQSAAQAQQQAQSDYQAKIDNLNQQLSSQQISQSQAAQLATQAQTDLQKQLDNLNTQLSGQNSSISGYQTQITDLNSQLAKLQSAAQAQQTAPVTQPTSAPVAPTPVAPTPVDTTPVTQPTTPAPVDTGALNQIAQQVSTPTTPAPAPVDTTPTTSNTSSGGVSGNYATDMGINLPVVPYGFSGNTGVVTVNNTPSTPTPVNPVTQQAPSVDPLAAAAIQEFNNNGLYPPPGVNWTLGDYLNAAQYDINYNRDWSSSPTIANGGMLIPVYAENGDPIPAPTPQIDNASNYQMAYDMGLEQSYDPNFNYADLYYNGTYSNIYGDPYSGGFSNLFANASNSQYFPTYSGGMAGVGIEGMPEDTWSWTPWNPSGSQTYGLGWLFGEDWNKGGSVDFNEIAKKYNIDGDR